MSIDNQDRASNNQKIKAVSERGVRIPIGKSSVKQMIDAGFYADKTNYIANLFEDEGTYYFFIRPRRFGKSLLLDTIDQIAKGNVAGLIAFLCFCWAPLSASIKSLPR